ncbi:class I SAM-dependent methyltransferase [Ramlibacter pallidus]|uniref:Class I SAM-dependent methyltransferase n=1 Tax=Ramlibacter pallidus TaxID=2780087 RepID=A0ABR9S8R6_9BURK|nr:class I SAM-dependent methyltransferase [Ramlibacter pallidus]MBE7369896.1 class I SAM-dependent methyltransferase [Ramlibacter pallidus]
MSTAYHPHGAAVFDCFRGERGALLVCHQDGERDDVPAAFWLRETMDPLEEKALALCRGRVLDAGAGAGLHTLALQRRGFDVTAIDVAPECVTVMRERGVARAEAADVLSYAGGPFDTILCLCNGLDKVGRLASLPHFLDRMRRLLAPGGALLADSFDVRVGASGSRRDALLRKQEEGRYFGETDMRFEYKGLRGAPFPVLQVDFETLSRVAGMRGWECERVDGTGGHYLARLAPR